MTVIRKAKHRQDTNITPCTCSHIRQLIYWDVAGRVPGKVRVKALPVCIHTCSTSWRFLETFVSFPAWVKSLYDCFVLLQLWGYEIRLRTWENNRKLSQENGVDNKYGCMSTMGFCIFFISSLMYLVIFLQRVQDCLLFLKTGGYVNLFYTVYI